MKNLPFIFSLITFILLSSCRDKTIEKVTFLANTPVYMSYEDLKASVKNVDSKTIENPGKIYYYQNYLLINERFEGLHIIDNSNPSSPQKIGFISIPANLDMAVKGNILYVDSYKDLIAIDISSIQSVKVVDRDEEVFPYTLPPRDNNYPYANIDESEGVVVGWEVKEITERNVINDNNNCFNCQFESARVDASSSTFSNSKSSNSEVATGTGGSTARFTLVGDYLYGVHGSDLKTIDISNLRNPILVNTVGTNREVETIFPAKEDKLFIGTTTGMLIYDLSSPTNPSYLSQFSHARACDPVVVEGNYAYVTTRTGSGCGGGQNQLSVINITNISNPYNEASYTFTNPHGLGIDNGTLFICDGTDGLKVYDASDIHTITSNQLSHFSNIQSTDVIPLNDVLMMIGDDGFYQYDYSDINNITLLSSIRIGE